MNLKATLPATLALIVCILVCGPAAGAAFLLKPDPATGKDAEINDGHQTSDNNGDFFDLIINWGSIARSIGLIEFDLSSVPTDEPVVSATLFLYHRENPLNAGSRYDLFRITSPWNEGSVLFATAPTFDPAPFSTLTIPVDGDEVYRTWDVTSLVAGWMGGAFPNYGMWIEEIPYYGPANAFFSSSDDTEFHRPFMHVVTGIPEPSTLAIAATCLMGVLAIRGRLKIRKLSAKAYN